MLLKIGQVLHGMQKDQKRKKGEEGFTLIELLVVVIIIGILAAIAIPVFLAQRDRAYDASATSDARNGATAATAYSTDNNGSYSGATTDILRDDYDWRTSAGTSGHTVTPTAGGDNFTIAVTSQSNRVATFDSATGEVELSDPPATP